MKNGLSRTVTLKNDRLINVFDIETKTVLFTGNIGDVSYYLGIALGHVSRSIQSKSKVKKKYALRYAKTENQ